MRIWILPAVIALAILAYWLSWRAKPEWLRRAALLVLTLLTALVALVGTLGYAVPALEDFHNSNVAFHVALIENALLWAICLGAWFLALRFIRFVVHLPPSHRQ